MKLIISREESSQVILKIFLALAISSAVAAIGTWARTSIIDRQDQPATRLTGIVSDTNCGSTHGSTKQGDAECTRLCVKLGSEYALAVGENIYVLLGHRAELNIFAGDMVVVKGKMLNRNTVAVESVAPYIVSTTFVKQ